MNSEWSTALPAERRPLSSLGRHLQRSILRTCLPPETLARLVPSASSNGGLLIDAACAATSEGGKFSEALDEALAGQHADTVADWAGETDYDMLRARWIAAAASSDMPGAYWALLTHPLADRTLRHLAYGDVEMLHRAGTLDSSRSTPDAPIDLLLARRSVAPRRLGEPAPTSEQIDLIVQAALAAPDHGRLRPWRVIEFPVATRDVLAQLFEEEKRRRDPLASASDLRKAREHALRPPCLLAFVVCLRERKRVPEREQMLAAGAALGNLVNASHALGFGAIVLSGDRCFDAGIARDVGLGDGEFLAGFVSIGSVLETPPEATRPLSQDAWSCWTPRRAPAMSTPTASAIEGSAP